MFWKRTTRVEIGDPTVSEHWIAQREYDSWGRPTNAIRGESRHNEVFLRLIGPVKTDHSARGYFHPVVVDISRERDNSYDSNACRALMWSDSRVQTEPAWIGYLANEIAAELAPMADCAGISTWRVPGVVMGGAADAPNFGCHVWLGRRLSPGPIWDRPEEPW